MSIKKLSTLLVNRFLKKSFCIRKVSNSFLLPTFLRAIFGSFNFRGFIFERLIYFEVCLEATIPSRPPFSAQN